MPDRSAAIADLASAGTLPWRRPWLPPLGLLAVSLGVLLLVSGVTGLSFAELDQLAQLGRMQEVVQGVAERGLSALSDSDSKAAYQSAQNRGPFLLLLSAWSRLSIGRLGICDPLTSGRLPFLVLAALAPPSLYLMLSRARGQLAALYAAGILLLLAAWVHGAVVEDPGTVLAAGQTLVLLCYVISLSGAVPRRRWCAAALGAALLGVLAGMDLALLWLLPLLFVHFVALRWRSARRSLRVGRVPLPTLLVLALPLAPLLVLATNPGLWGGSISATARWLLSPLSPSVTPSLYAGELVKAAPLPGGYSFTWLVHRVPVSVVLLALVGFLVSCHRGLARRFASGALKPARDPAGIGLLAGLGSLYYLSLPSWAPQVLATFPPRSVLALPFVALLAGIGLDAATRRALGPRRAVWLGLAVLTACALMGLRAPSALGARFAPLSGGARGVVASRVLPAGDGSELAGLLPELEASGAAELSVFAPEVPPRYWSAMAETGRLGVRVIPSARPTLGGYRVERQTAADAGRGLSMSVWRLSRVD